MPAYYQEATKNIASTLVALACARHSHPSQLKSSRKGLEKKGIANKRRHFRAALFCKNEKRRTVSSESLRG
jgi:hypothetical protein